MKKNKTILNQKTMFITLCFLMISLFSNAQDGKKPKNNFYFGAGLSIPVLTVNSTSENVAYSGSNFSASYGRNIYSKKSGYLTLDVKYLSVSNPYALLDSDVLDINSTSPSVLGTWTGSSDNFKLSAYLLGLSWYNYISKNEKWTCFARLYVGSSSLTSPSTTFNSSNGYVIQINEIKDNAFAYSSSAGLSYGITKNISLGVNLDYIKSSFYFENQQINYSGGGSDVANPYTMSYANLNVNSEIIFKF